MATTPTRAQALFTVPFSHSTDFTELANHCECLTLSRQGEGIHPCNVLKYLQNQYC
ncbi:hypothetical protein [Leclercia tamurae]|uniref:hypothetical protein n=1 Tax=Leclercia tamurae TaxID=2926467 RepID=UPI0036F467BC